MAINNNEKHRLYKVQNNIHSYMKKSTIVNNSEYDFINIAYIIILPVTIR